MRPPTSGNGTSATLPAGLHMSAFGGFTDERAAIEIDGDTLADLHLWRLGQGHLGAIVSVVAGKPRSPDFYRARLRSFHGLSHVTIEVHAR